ncbi:hypothetical protein [Vulcanisaeta sp. JCM 16159]|uniref:hypothetical protein n=1 Tax=Vulcanisaeta sp. JCM 16159 TaxID=1295371 RepID=UPI001FB4B93D|nr:hypothetical protein [Vulcanisaeta sp. JCM 16159]
MTREILDKLPSNAADRVKELIEEGIKIAQNRTLLRHDFAGRIYHEITGDNCSEEGLRDILHADTCRVPTRHVGC